MSEISLKNLIIPTFHKVHKDIKQGLHTEYWLKGGRGSTKSTFISIELVLNLIADENGHAVVFRKIGNKLETSVYNQIKWAINALRLNSYFKFSKSPLKIEYLPTGQLILFCGLDDPENSKSIKLPFGYIKQIWFEELNQFDGMAEIRKVKQSAIRGGDDAIVFYSYNPPPEINNWVNKEARIENPNRLVHHSTYLDVPPEFLGKAFLIEAEHLKKLNPKAYEHEYLGKVIGTGLNVFNNVIARKIPASERNKFEKVCEGIDWGYAIDPFVWIQCHYERKYKRLYIYNEIYQIGLFNTDAIDLVKKKHKARCEIIADSEEPKSIDEFADAGLPIRKASKPAGSVSFGTKKLQGLEQIIIDPERCPNALREFLEYSLEQNKDGTIKSKFPDKDNHTIDAVRYSLEDEFDY